MIFNGTDLSSLILVTAIGGRGLLGQEVIRTTVPGKDGSYPLRRYLKERPIPVDFVITNGETKSIREKVDELTPILRFDQDAPIVFPDEPGRTYYGALDGQPDWDEIKAIGRGRFHFLCSDPCKYGIEKTLSFGNSVNFNPGGNYKTFPKIEITFTATSSECKITHQSGKYVRVIKNFIVGDTLIIDFATGKITLNGSVSMQILDWVNSEFFTLSPGTQTLTVSPSGKGNSKVSWKPRWT